MGGGDADGGGGGSDADGGGGADNDGEPLRSHSDTVITWGRGQERTPTRGQKTPDTPVLPSIGVTRGGSLNLSGPWFPARPPRADTLYPTRASGLGGAQR